MNAKLRNHCKRIAKTKGDTAKHAKVWQVMRIMRRFTINDLLAVCELQPNHRTGVKNYLHKLKRAGYLSMNRVSPSTNECSYLLIRDTGPTCPSVVHYATVVYDHNTQQEHTI